MEQEGPRLEGQGHCREPGEGLLQGQEKIVAGTEVPPKAWKEIQEPIVCGRGQMA
jgi:hypothetical protein